MISPFNDAGLMAADAGDQGRAMRGLPAVWGVVHAERGDAARVL